MAIITLISDLGSKDSYLALAGSAVRTLPTMLGSSFLANVDLHNGMPQRLVRLTSHSPK